MRAAISSPSRAWLIVALLSAFMAINFGDKIVLGLWPGRSCGICI